MAEPWHKRYNRSPEDLLKTVPKDFKSYAEFKQRFEQVFGKDSATFTRDGQRKETTPSNVWKGVNGMSEEDLRALYEESYSQNLTATNLLQDVEPFAGGIKEKQETLARQYEKQYEMLLKQKRYDEARPWGQRARELREQMKSVGKLSGELLGDAGDKARKTNVQKYVQDITKFRQILRSEAQRLKVPVTPPLKPPPPLKPKPLRRRPFPWHLRPAQLAWIYNRRKIKETTQLRENFYHTFGFYLTSGAIASKKYAMRKLTPTQFKKKYQRAQQIKQERFIKMEKRIGYARRRIAYWQTQQKRYEEEMKAYREAVK